MIENPIEKLTPILFIVFFGVLATISQRNVVNVEEWLKKNPGLVSSEVKAGQIQISIKGDKL